MREVIMMIFPTRGSMVDATDKLHDIAGLQILQAALIVRAEHGEVTIFEDDISPTEGAITGGTLGGLIGALGVAGLGAFLLPGVGPIIAISAGVLAGGLIGGTTGGVAARLIDHGLNNRVLEELARQLADNEIAAVMDVEGDERQFEEAAASIAQYHGKFIIVSRSAESSEDDGPVPPAPIP